MLIHPSLGLIGAQKTPLAGPQAEHERLVSFHLAKAASRCFNRKLSAAVKENASETSADGETQKAKLGSEVAVSLPPTDAQPLGVKLQLKSSARGRGEPSRTHLQVQ